VCVWQVERASPGWSAARAVDCAARCPAGHQSLGQCCDQVRAVSTTPASGPIMGAGYLGMQTRTTCRCSTPLVTALGTGFLDRILDVETVPQQRPFRGPVTQQIADAAQPNSANRSMGNPPCGPSFNHARRRQVTSERSADANTRRRDPAGALERHRLHSRLPAELRHCPRKWPQGRLSNASAYPTPFLRSAGFSGEALVRQGPGVHHLRRSARSPTAGSARVCRLGPASFGRLPAISAHARSSVFAATCSAMKHSPTRLLRSKKKKILGRSRIPPGRPQRRWPPGSGHATGLVAAPGSAHPWAGNRDSRRVDRLPDGAEACSGQRAGRRGALASYELMRLLPAIDSFECPQLRLPSAAVPVLGIGPRQLDEADEIRAAARFAGTAHQRRQKPVALSADHQRGAPSCRPCRNLPTIPSPR